MFCTSKPSKGGCLLLGLDIKGPSCLAIAAAAPIVPKATTTLSPALIHKDNCLMYFVDPGPTTPEVQ